MPKLEEALIDRLTLRPEVREKARALLRLVHSKTGPGTGYDIGEAKTGVPAMCAYIASKSAGYADVTQEIAQKASCLAPKTFASTFNTVKAVILASKTPDASPSKSGSSADPTAYATLICEHKIGQPLRVESWMKEAQAALTVLPLFRNDFASRLSESGPEVRLAVFFWICRAIKLSTVKRASLIDNYGVSPDVFSRLVQTMEDECVDLKESIRATIKEMRQKKAATNTTTEAASSSKKTPTSGTASRLQPQSRSASPTKSALRDTSKTPSRASYSPTKRKVAFSLSDASASESDYDGVFAPETPSKRPRTTTTPRRAATAATANSTRVLPVRKAASSESISSEEQRAEEEDVEMLDVPPPPAPLTPRRLVASEPVVGPSTPLRRSARATPTHAYRTPPSARIQMRSLLSGDEEDEGVDGVEAEEEEDNDVEGGNDDDDALPLSRRFRPVFLDRAQWAQRAPRVARDRAVAERRTKELIERWGYPFAFLERDATSRVGSV